MRFHFTKRNKNDKWVRTLISITDERPSDDINWIHATIFSAKQAVFCVCADNE